MNTFFNVRASISTKCYWQADAEESNDNHTKSEDIQEEKTKFRYAESGSLEDCLAGYF